MEGGNSEAWGARALLQSPKGRSTITQDGEKRCWGQKRVFGDPEVKVVSCQWELKPECGRQEAA